MHPAVHGDRPLIFAHRGGAGLAPENTIPAFDRALAIGADGLELDVHLSSDRVAVVHHDPLLDRTTNATGPVGARTAAELASVDACAGFARSGRPWDGGPAGVPTLGEVLRRYPAVKLIVELKGPSRTLARAVVDEVRNVNAFDRTCLAGVSWRALQEARRCERRLATGASQLEVRLALYGSWIGLGVHPCSYDALQVPECMGGTRVVSPRFIRSAHGAGKVVQVWTVDDPADIRRLLTWDVDAILTDRPDVAVRARDEWIGEGRGRNG